MKQPDREREKRKKYIDIDSKVSKKHNCVSCELSILRNEENCPCVL